MSQNNEKNIDAIGTVIAVLESGNSVELNARGYSMFPTIMPDDRVVVRPLTKGELPEPGNIIVFRINDDLVIHRLIEIKNISGQYFFLTRGDSMKKPDPSQKIESLKGVAVSFKRGGKVHMLKRFLPLAVYYYFNYLSLLVYFRKKKRVPILVKLPLSKI